MLSPEQVQQYRQQYNLSSGDPAASVSSNWGKSTPEDRIKSLDNVWSKKTETPTAPPKQEETQSPSLVSRLGTDIKETLGGMTKDITSPDIRTTTSPFSATGQMGMLGEAAKGANKVIGDVAQSAWGAVPDFMKNALAEGATNLAGGQQNVDKLKDLLGKGVSAYTTWTEKHPEAAKALERSVHGVAFGLGGEGAGAAKEAVAPVLEKAGEVATQALKPVAEKAGIFKEALAPTMKPEVEQLAKKLGIDAKDKAFQEALEATKPTYGPKAKEIMAQSGKVKEVGLGKTPEVMPTEADVRSAHAVKDIINPKATPFKNTQAVNKEIGRISKEEIRPSLEANNSIYNRDQLKKTLTDKISSAPGYADDPAVKTAYDRAVREMLVKADAESGHLLGAHDARIAFDKAESSIFPKTGDFFRDSLGKTAARDVRGAMNDFIGSKLPENVRSTFEKARSLQSDMFQARNNIAKSASKSIGKNYISRTLKAHPWLKLVAPSVGGYEIFNILHKVL